MPFNATGKDQMLDALTVDRVRLHSGDPGAAGTDNDESGLLAATFGSASAGVRALSSDVEATGLTPSVDITWFSIWLNSGTVYKGKGLIDSGDVAANASGEYTLTTDTELRLVDA